MTATRTETIEHARAFRGLSESPPYSNNVLFSRWYGLIGPWCAMYVSYVLNHVGNPWPVTTPKGFAYVPEGVRAAQERGVFHDATWGGAQAGDLIFYSFGGRRPDHVGFVIDHLDDGRWHTIEGNTGSDNRDGGSVQERYRRTGVIGFAALDFATPAETRSYVKFGGRTINVGTVGEDVKAWKQYMIVLGIAPEFATQNEQQLQTFGAETSVQASLRFKVLWNAIYRQRRGDPQWLDPSTPAIGPKVWQAVIFSVAAQQAKG